MATRRAFLSIADALILAILTTCITAVHAADKEIFFDDFSYENLAALRAGGWQERTQAGHPGVPEAHWGDGSLSIVDDAEPRGNRLLRLSAHTDGSPDGTVQAQVCHQRKYLAGTYAARIRFSDTPVKGIDGDPIIQTFYAVAPLRYDFDPEFSEIDWEYLPNGGWGSNKTRLYGIAWQTVRIEPWQAHNQAHEEFGSLAGWHTLMMQVADGKTRHYLDGRLLAVHGGRNYPIVPMSINFNLWFSPSGLLPKSDEARVYQQDIDWVLHARNVTLTPTQVETQVRVLRARKVKHLDQVPPASPALESRCDF